MNGRERLLKLLGAALRGVLYVFIPLVVLLEWVALVGAEPGTIPELLAGSGTALLAVAATGFSWSRSLTRDPDRARRVGIAAESLLKAALIAVLASGLAFARERLSSWLELPEWLGVVEGLLGATVGIASGLAMGAGGVGLWLFTQAFAPTSEPGD